MRSWLMLKYYSLKWHCPNMHNKPVKATCIDFAPRTIMKEAQCAAFPRNPVLCSIGLFGSV